MRRVLLVHTGGGIGDVLLSTPLLAALHRHYPEAKIDFLARSSTAPVLEGNPYLSRLFTLDCKAPPIPMGVVREARKLKGRGYDAAVVLWSVTGIAWTLFLAGIPVRVGQSSRLSYSFLYTHKVKVRSEHGDDQTHWTEILLDYVRALGVPAQDPRVTYVVPDQARQKALELLGGEDNPPLVGFHTGKGIPLSPGRWPVDLFAEWARALVEELNVRVVLTGGPDEVELVKAVEDLVGVPVINLAGRTELAELGAVAQRCRVFVCPDSGPMHLAAAVGTPVVGIYALEEDFPRRWAPHGVPCRVLRPEQPGCRPGCLKATCPDFRCYRQVETSQIVGSVRELLEGVSRG